jgi:hypothetical protein
MGPGHKARDDIERWRAWLLKAEPHDRCHPGACPRDPWRRILEPTRNSTQDFHLTTECADEWVPETSPGMTLEGGVSYWPALETLEAQLR